MAAPTESWKAIWVVRDQLASPLAARNSVETAAALGATDLFVQVRGRGDAYYRSRLEPAPWILRHELVGDSLRFDPLAIVLEEARARGLRVHAWLNVFLVWSDGEPLQPQHLLARHPEWAVVAGDGRSLLDLSRAERKDRELEGVFVSPAIPDVRRDAIAVAKDLVARYPLDGVHWDYVRYPRGAMGYEAEAIARFLADAPDSVVTADAAGANVPTGEPRAESTKLDAAFLAWRADQVSAFVRDASLELRALRPDLRLSAAVVPDADEARSDVAQDWPRWLREGWIDRACPMAYTISETRLADWMRRWDFHGLPRERLVPGLAAWRNDEPALSAQLRLVREGDFAGAALFSLRDLSASPSRRRAALEAYHDWTTGSAVREPDAKHPEESTIR